MPTNWLKCKKSGEMQQNWASDGLKVYIKGIKLTNNKKKTSLKMYQIETF